MLNLISSQNFDHPTKMSQWMLLNLFVARLVERSRSIPEVRGSIRVGIRQLYI